MSVFILKLIAMGSMVIDHLGYSYFFGNQVMRFIGRFAFIIYAFLIAEGYYHLNTIIDVFTDMIYRYEIFCR